MKKGGKSMMGTKKAGPGLLWVFGLTVGTAIGLSVVAYYIWLA